jgi:hypothetical protein
VGGKEGMNLSDVRAAVVAIGAVLRTPGWRPRHQNQLLLILLLFLPDACAGVKPVGEFVVAMGRAAR